MVTSYRTKPYAYSIELQDINGEPISGTYGSRLESDSPQLVPSIGDYIEEPAGEYWQVERVIYRYQDSTYGLNTFVDIRCSKSSADLA
jgi:hypothetical protein